MNEKKGVKKVNFHNNFVDLNVEMGIQWSDTAKKLGQLKTRELQKALVDLVKKEKHKLFEKALKEGKEIDLHTLSSLCKHNREKVYEQIRKKDEQTNEHLLGLARRISTT